MRLVLFISIFALMTLISACRNKLETRQELLSYLQKKENGLLVEDKKGDVLTSASYIPYQLLKKNSGHRYDDTQSSTDTWLNSSRTYFAIHFSKNGKELLGQLNMNIYSEIFQTLSFGMVPFVSIRTDDGRSISPLACFFQQTYGLGSSNELILIFNSADIGKSDKYNLSVNEFGLGIGDLKYTFVENAIDKLNRRLNL